MAYRAIPALLLCLSLSACSQLPDWPVFTPQEHRDASHPDSHHTGHRDTPLSIDTDEGFTSLRDEARHTHPSIEGRALGYYLDVQTARLQELARDGVTVDKRSDHILLLMPGEASFASDSASLKPGMRELLGELAAVLREYQSNLILIGGHSDNLGDPGYNLELSRRRARAVADYFMEAGVEAPRLVVRGFGDARPIADNATEAGRAQNRRIELGLWPVIEPSA